MNICRWWGYLHINGHIQVKRYFDSRDLEDAGESPFVLVIFPVFLAQGRDDAIAQCYTKLRNSLHYLSKI